MFDIEGKSFYFLWINESLISELDLQNPNWKNQKNIQIKIPKTNKFEKQVTIETIKEYVFRWKMPTRRNIESGKYFELKNAAHILLEEYKNITQAFVFSSINDTIENLSRDIEQSIYRIALTGLSRVGKSSLINALLNKEVSPIGFFQTTGVPIQVIPGSSDKVNIYFQDGRILPLAFSLENIKQYVSKDYNEDNEKKVKLVSISIKNQNLERGVSLFDIPGLDDPNDDILDYTWQTIRTVNAPLSPQTEKQKESEERGKSLALSFLRPPLCFPFCLKPSQYFT